MSKPRPRPPTSSTSWKPPAQRRADPEAGTQARGEIGEEDPGQNGLAHEGDRVGHGGQPGPGKREWRQLSKRELYQQATEQGIDGRSKIRHDELVQALARAGRRRKKTAA